MGWPWKLLSLVPHPCVTCRRNQMSCLYLLAHRHIASSIGVKVGRFPVTSSALFDLPVVSFTSVTRQYQKKPDRFQGKTDTHQRKTDAYQEYPADNPDGFNYKTKPDKNPKPKYTERLQRKLSGIREQHGDRLQAYTYGYTGSEPTRKAFKKFLKSNIDNPLSREPKSEGFRSPKASKSPRSSPRQSDQDSRYRLYKPAEPHHLYDETVPRWRWDRDDAGPDLISEKEEGDRDEDARSPKKPKQHKKKEKIKYNHGLSGVGKVPSYMMSEAPVPVNGEVLFGLHCVLQALTAQRRTFHQLYVKKTLIGSDQPIAQEFIAKADEQGLSLKLVSRTFLDLLSQARPHQGVCADVSKLYLETIELTGQDRSNAEEAPKIWLIMDSIQDPMNFGAVLRSAYYLGVDKVLVTSENSCSLTPVASRASAGAMEIMPVYSISEPLPAVLQQCQRDGWTVLGTMGHQAPPGLQPKAVALDDVHVHGNTVLVLGNEGTGLSAETLAVCDNLLSIRPGGPLHDYMDSLNVSVATGILLHHLTKGRRQG